MTVFDSLKKRLGSHRQTVIEPVSASTEQEEPRSQRASSLGRACQSGSKAYHFITHSHRKNRQSRNRAESVGNLSNARQDVLEENLYTDYNTSIETETHEPPAQPLPDAVASLSKFKKHKSSRTMFRTLAGAIGVPTVWFVQREKAAVEGREPLLENGADQSHITPAISPTKTILSRSDVTGVPSPVKTMASKKSVRFTDSQSLTRDITPSSPIDVPISTTAPSLPPIHFSSTPLHDFFGTTHPDLIPTGRYRSPPPVEADTTFYRARAARDAKDHEADIDKLTPLRGPLSEVKTWTSTTIDPAEDPFVDLEAEHLDHGKERVTPGEEHADPEQEVGSDNEHGPVLYMNPAFKSSSVLSDRANATREVRESESESVDSSLLALPPTPNSARNELDPRCGTLGASASMEHSEDLVGMESNNHNSDDQARVNSAASETGDTAAGDMSFDLAFTDTSAQTVDGSNGIWGQAPTHEDIRARFQHPKNYTGPNPEVANTTSASELSEQPRMRASRSHADVQQDMPDDIRHTDEQGDSSFDEEEQKQLEAVVRAGLQASQSRQLPGSQGSRVRHQHESTWSEEYMEDSFDNREASRRDQHASIDDETNSPAPAV